MLALLAAAAVCLAAYAFVRLPRPASARATIAAAAAGCAGVWAIALSAFVLIFAFGIPALAHSFAPAQAAVVASLVGALAEASQGPALVLAGAGVAGLVTSFLWKPAANAVLADPPPARSRRPQRRRRPAHPPTQRIPRQPRGQPRGRPSPPPRPRPGPPTPSAPPRTSGAAPTRVQSTVPSAPARPPVEDRPGRRWVEGTGWVLDGSESIPADARWVPGVGYVVDS